jgi:tRNA(Arg) A34 adenosine deaminase TadA
MRYPQFVLQLPDWVEAFLPAADTVYPTVEDRMRLVIALSRYNVKQGTGGPFGAAIFHLHTHRLFAAGVNLVTSVSCAILHAEMVAIIMAQQMAGHYDLGKVGMPAYELVSSTEPCAMCFGAVLWSGVRQLVCGAREEDARQVGFDEGPKVVEWIQALENRGITVVRDICRHEAAAVLRQYSTSGGIIYNSRQP